MFPRSCCLVSHCVRRSLSGDETWELQSGHRNSGWFKVWQARGRSCSSGMCQAWSRPGGLQRPGPHPPPALLVLGTPQICRKRNGCSAGSAQGGELWGWQCCTGEMGMPRPSQPALAPGRRISIHCCCSLRTIELFVLEKPSKTIKSNPSTAQATHMSPSSTLTHLLNPFRDGTLPSPGQSGPV